MYVNFLPEAASLEANVQPLSKKSPTFLQSGLYDLLASYALINMYPHPPSRDYVGNSGAFTSVLTMLWSPGVGYLIREQTRATCRLYRLCAVFQTPGPIASVLLQAPENKKARVSRVVYCSVLATGHGGACLYKL